MGTDNHIVKQLLKVLANARATAPLPAATVRAGTLVGMTCARLSQVPTTGRIAIAWGTIHKGVCYVAFRSQVRTARRENQCCQAVPLRT
jgi:hypothetical protein